MPSNFTTGTVLDNWPAWTDENTFHTRNFEFNCSTTVYEGKTSDRSVALLKNRSMLEAYRDLLVNFDVKNIFEIGFFQGGMPLFLSETVGPDRIVGIDRGTVTEALKDAINSTGLGERVRLYGGVEQDDSTAIKGILEGEFGGAPLDLIIDDCSHEYGHTKTCFEEYFGYLRPGGKYVIEDWGWLHWQEGPWQTSESYFYSKPALTSLIFEIVMLHASHPEFVSRVEILSPYCTIMTRGSALAPNDRIDIDRSYLTAGRKVLVPGGATLFQFMKMRAHRRLKRLMRMLRAKFVAGV